MGYPSDLTDKGWGLIKHHFEPEDPRGDACKHDRKQVVDAIFYWAKSGVQWRMPPNCFPLWKTVHGHYSRWNKRGIWGAMPEGLNGRNPGPGYGIINPQRAKTQYGGDGRGIDGNKKVKGRKRHIVVDIPDNLPHVGADAANIHDTVAAGKVMRRAEGLYPGIGNFSGDAGYRGTAVRYADGELGVTLHISEKIRDGFAVLPKRRVAGLTFRLARPIPPSGQGFRGAGRSPKMWFASPWSK